MTRITVNLTNQEREALIALAGKELRHPRAQAALIIRVELQRQGLIEVIKPALAVTAEITQPSMEGDGKVGTAQE
ncbi:MAG: hypothetical protein HY865_09000 [Chloroflexi bacterium]|nr:hypothetical protein [Chloroflexota bacterium]